MKFSRPKRHMKLACRLPGTCAWLGHHGKALLFDTREVFEDFVSVALREVTEGDGSNIDLQYRGKYLDVAGKVSLRPDTDRGCQ